MQETNLNCPCKKLKCPRHGNCIECKKHHENNSISCERLKKQQDK